MRGRGITLVAKTIGDENAQTHKVNLGIDGRTPSCDCNNFRLRGIPCSEACALIHRLGLDPCNFVRQELKAISGLTATETALIGCKFPSVVKSTLYGSNPVILPPLLQPPPGRPAKKRKTSVSVKRAFVRSKLRKEKQVTKTGSLEPISSTENLNQGTKAWYLETVDSTEY